MRENQLNELQGVSILTKEFFNKLIRRIECTKPLAGAGIIITQQENGVQISGGGGGGIGSVADYSAITLNVCSNGEPAEILVLGKPVEE
jgi:hypothetical protein